MKLTQKESAIIRLRYGLEDDIQRTYADIAGIVEMSQTMVKQLEKKAIRKLRHPSNKKALFDIQETLDMLNNPNN